MSTKKLRKIVVLSLSIVALLGLTLAVHIYMVKKHKPVADATTLSMARIDFKQPLTSGDADKISAWLSRQTGVTHVLCNEASGIAVFSFYPVKANADHIVSNLKSSLNYTADRFTPTAESMKSGCPAGF